MTRTIRIGLRPLIFLALTASAAAQITLNLLGTDITQYPTVKLTFNATDGSGNRIDTFSPSDFTVSENGMPKTVLSVNCPPPPAQSISLTLTFDISYSMTGGNRMPNARSAATTMVNLFNYPPTETGITTFDEKPPTILLPWTSNKTSILTAIAGITPSNGATDLYGAFMNPSSGAIPFTAGRSGKRAIVFLTDAYEILTTTEVNNIIAAANAANIAIYTVLVISNPPPPMPMRTIATSTGGKWFENVVTEQQAKDVYTQIAVDIINPPPCELTYLSSGCETTRNATVTLNKLSASASQNFPLNIPAASISRVDASRLSMDFGVLLPPQTRDIPVTITARVKAANVQSITTDKSQFSVISYGGTAPPFALGLNQSRTLTVRYTPTDTSRIVGSLLINSDASCNAEPILAGGNVSPPPLRVVQPNGGEQLSVGTPYLIRWDGINPSDQVGIEYSTDAGNAWSTISLFGSGLNSGWNVPNTPSNRCLMRVSMMADPRTAPKDKTFVPWGNDEIYSVAFSDDGTILASGGNDRILRVWRPDNGDQLMLLPGHAGAIRSISFSQKNGWIATGSADRSVRIWNLNDGSVARTLNVHAYAVHSIAFSADGTHFVSADQQDIKLWRTSDWGMDWNMAGYSDVNGAVSIDRRVTMIATARGNNAYILDASSGAPIRTFSGHAGKVRSVAFSPDGTLLATGSDDMTVKIWRISDGTVLQSFNGHGAGVSAVAFSRDGSRIASASADKTIRIWKRIDGTNPVTLLGHGAAVNSVAFSPDRTLIASGSTDRTVRVWGYTAPMSDDSDSLWAIISANATIDALPMQFHTLLCPQEPSTDTTITISNAGNKALTITAAAFTGANPGDFELVSPASIPPDFVIPPGRNADFTVRFHPAATGARAAILELTSNASNAAAYDIPVGGRKDSLGVIFSRPSLDFAESYECSTTEEIGIRVSNTGSIPVTIDSATITPPDGYFVFSPPFPLTLPAGSDSVVSVRFAPPAIGSFNAFLRLRGLSCGLLPEARVSGARATAIPGLSDTLIDFGAVTVGNQSTKSILIRNRTHAAMRVNGLSILPAGGDAGFVSVPSLPLTIPPLDSVRIDLRFAPSKDGIYSGTLRVETDFPCATSQDVRLDGIASTSPFIAAATPSFATLVCAADSTGDAVVTIRNNGGQTLQVSQSTLAGANAADFRIIGGGAPFAIPPGGQTSVTIRFNSAGSGDRAAQLHLISNAVNAADYVVPLAARRERIGYALDAASLDFGIAYECSTSTLRRFTITNRSTRRIQIDSLHLAGNPVFRCATAFPVALDSGMAVTIDVAFEPTIDGTFSGTATVFDSPCGIRTALPLSGVRSSSAAQLSAKAMDFGLVGVGQFADRSITITNPTTSPIIIGAVTAQPPAAAGYILQPATPLPWTIPAGGSLQLTLRYAPAAADTLNGWLQLAQTTPCSVQHRIDLTGMGALAAATVELPVAGGMVGAIVQLPLTLRNSRNFAAAGVQSFRATLRYNRTMLWLNRITEPSGGSATVTGTRSSRDTAFADIQVTETAPPADGAIATAEFLVMLGNSDSTQLDLENWQWINGVAATTLRSGSFTAQGICTAGGRRLVNPPEALALWPNAPNPFGEKSGSGANVTRIDFYLPAEMPARLDVYGALGNRLATLTQETLAKGMHTVLFDAARFDLRSGAYYILLSAEGNRLVRRMTLLR